MSDFDHIIASLRSHGVGFEPGLSDAEVARVEDRFGFAFPPDLREFLQRALPVSLPPSPGATHDRPFPNWRGESDDSLRHHLEWPLEGLLFDVERNNRWFGAGKRPDDPQEALHATRELVRQAPVLIPVYGHRFLPESPCAEGNPVLSVWQGTGFFRWPQPRADFAPAC